MASRSPAVVAFAFAALASACGGATHEPGDPLRTLPIDVSVAVVVPSITRLQETTSGFLQGLPGAGGVLELVAERYGLDLRTPEGVVAIGLEPARGAAVWAPADASGLVIAVPVRDAQAFARHVEQRLVRAAGGSAVGTAPEAWATPRGYLGPVPPGASTPAWRAAFGVTDDGVGIVALTGDAADPGALWSRAADERGGLVAAADGRYAKAKATAGEGAILYMMVRDILPETPAELGFAKGFVDNIRGGLTEWQGGLVAAEDRLALRIASDFSKEGALPVSWVSPTGAADVIAKALPKTTTALLRLRVNLDKLRALPDFIVAQFLPDQIPGLEMLPIPALSDVIELVEGDVGVAFLGIDPQATFGHLTSLRALRERALETFRVALVARLRDRDGALRQFAGIADQLGTSGWTVAPIDPQKAGGWSGWSFVRGPTTYSVLIDDKVIVFVIGPGEVDAFVAARSGRATTLGAYGQGFDATVQEALGLAPAGGGTALGVSLGFLRVTRELADKGVPPFFLKMLSRIRLVGLSIGAEERRVTLAIEVAR